MTLPVNLSAQQRSFTVNRNAHFCSAKRLHCKRWLRGANRHSPVNSFQQHGQLRWRQNHRTAQSLRPYEAAFFQPLGKQTQALSIPPQQFDNIAAPPPKHKDVTAKGIELQSALRKGSQFCIDRRAR
jgi:hypothetical protein